ncbi:MAG: hypothetical protein AM326_09740 [Candidatus Thorarchaeota archaeon SMTZ-45]|nr:MAG: hypothetical protein AM326_09740 [Candidatus Thorarchaeota archaeon SMTZ-45]
MVFSGVLLGAALPWLFSALNMKAVTRAAGEMVKEVRRQFKIPGILEGTVKPDYDRAVGISTTAAQKELISLAVCPMQEVHGITQRSPLKTSLAMLRIIQAKALSGTNVVLLVIL